MQIEFNKTAKFFIEGLVTKPNIKMRLKHNFYDYNVVTIPSTDKRNKIILLSILPTAENSQYPASGIIYLKYGGHYTVEFFTSDNTNLTINDEDLFIKSEQVYYKTQIPENYAMPGNRATKSLPTEQNNPLDGNKSQTYTFTFEAGSSQYNAQTINQQGTISTITSSVPVTLRVSTNQPPFGQNVQVGDTLQKGASLICELSQVPQSTITVEVVVSYADTIETKTMPVNDNYRYMYILSYENQLVDVYDTDINKNTGNHPIIQTVSLPGGNTFVSMHYRPYDKRIHVWGHQRKVEIDADPQSANFNTIVNDISQPLNIASSAYNYVEDVFYILQGGRITPATNLNKVKPDGTVLKKVGSRRIYSNPRDCSFDNHTQLLAINPRNYRYFYNADLVLQRDDNPAGYASLAFNTTNSILYMQGSGINGFITQNNLTEIFKVNVGRSNFPFILDDANQKILTLALEVRQTIVFDTITNTVENIFGNLATKTRMAQGNYSPFTGFCYVIQQDALLRVFDLSITSSTPQILSKQITDIDSNSNFINLYTGTQIMAFNGLQTQG